MTGEYDHTLDSKGRLFIPAKLREELGDSFYVTVSDEKCLWAYTQESWERRVEKYRSLPYKSRKDLRFLFTAAARCELDAQGRILLPQQLRSFAELSKNVTVVGCEDHAELWDSANWKPIHDRCNSPEYLAAAMEEIDF